MEKWLASALDYIPRWLDYQMRMTEQPGCALAVTHKGRVVLDLALGHADLGRGLALTPRHRFRVASHSKTFTAAAVLLLRERGLLHLDQPIGQHVSKLPPEVAKVSLGQLLSHSAGLVRDGADGGQWSDRRLFLNETELRADLADGPTIDAGLRFKYSNHGYALLGLAIEAVTGESYSDWISREIVAASGLQETQPDAPIAAGTPIARGHSSRLPLGRRVVIPVENPTHVLAAATGFISTASDLASFFASLSPGARKSVLSVASRREMLRRQWRDGQLAAERWYGLGCMSGSLNGWDWYGHSGGFQGTITRTALVPAQDLSVSVLTNAADGASQLWLEGVLHVLRICQQMGAPSRLTAPWSGRWWSLWGAVDLLPTRGRVLALNPGLTNPTLDASEIEVGRRQRDGSRCGRIVGAAGMANFGEPASLQFDAKGRPTVLSLGSAKLLPEAKVAKELRQKYEKTAA